MVNKELKRIGWENTHQKIRANQTSIISGLQGHHNSTLQKAIELNATSIQNSPVSGSLATLAVKPAAEEDLPDV